MCGLDPLRSTDDLVHGLVEAQAEDLDKEVNGIAGPVTLGPAPIAVFEDETRKGGQKEIARFLFKQLESPFMKQWPERRHAGGADLVT